MTTRGRLLRDIGLVAAAGLVAWGLALIWSAPAPIFSTDHAVPRVLDLGLQDAERRISALGFRPRFAGTEQHPGVPTGRVVGQDPPAGVILPAGSAVQLTTSATRTPVLVPDVIGFAATHAARVLDAAGLAAATVDSITDGADAPGVVVATRPAAGVSEDAGTAIGLVVSAAGVGRP
jgi:eukaryotic-like serine/threonine-protein kinase